MKLEHVISQYLYQNRSLSLQGIGQFTISPDIALPVESDKDAALPPNAIQFEYNPKAPTDEGLVDFIISKMRKIRPLASSDLDTFESLSKQVLNIGKPLEVEGLGTLYKNQAGGYEFAQGNAFRVKAEPAQVEIKEKINRDISFSSPKKEKQATAGWVMPLAIVLIIAGLGALGYYFYTQRKKPSETIQNTEALDTATHAAPVADSNVIKKDSLSAIATQPAVKLDSTNFKLIINTFPSEALAEKSKAKLNSYGHKTLRVETLDSVTFKLVMPFKNALTDTALVKDSIKKVFPKAKLEF